MQKRVANDGGKKVATFFRRNIYYVLMVVCVIAIGAMITVAAVVNNKGGDTDVVAPPDEIPPVGKQEEFILQMPVEGGVVSRAFNDSRMKWDETTGSFRTHAAVDFKIAAGSNVTAVFGGVVDSVTKDSAYGTTVVIDHKNGYKTTYRLISDSTMTTGLVVKKGDLIGKVSPVMVYERAEGDHLHIEMTKAGVYVNPMDFIPEGNK